MKRNKLIVYGLLLLCAVTQPSLKARGGGGGGRSGGFGGGHGGGFRGGGHSAGFSGHSSTSHGDGGRGGSGREGSSHGDEGHSGGHSGHGGRGHGYGYGGYRYGGFYGWGWGFGAGFLLADLALSQPTQTIIIENMDAEDLKKATLDLQERSNKQANYIQELEKEVQKLKTTQKAAIEIQD